MEEREGYTFLSFFFNHLLIFKKWPSGRGDGVCKGLELGLHGEEIWKKLKQIGEAKMGKKYLVLVSALEPVLRGEKPQTTKPQTKTPSRQKICDGFWFTVMFSRRGSPCGVFFRALGVVPRCCEGCGRAGRGRAALPGRGGRWRCWASAAPLQMAALRGSARRCGPAWAGAFLPTQPDRCPACCSGKFRVNHRVQTAIVEGDTSRAGSDRWQPLPAQASSCPFHFELLWRTKRFFWESEKILFITSHTHLSAGSKHFFLLYLEHLVWIQELDLWWSFPSFCFFLVC